MVFSVPVSNQNLLTKLNSPISFCWLDMAIQYLQTLCVLVCVRMCAYARACTMNFICDGKQRAIVFPEQP